MDKVAPLLMSFLDQQARPQVQSKVTEQLNTTKGDLKNDLPNTILNYLSGKDAHDGAGGNPMISQLVSSLGPNLLKSVSSVTNATVDTASEGMDTLLTNGIMNIAKSVLTQGATNANGGPAETGGINFDFLKSGKEGMVNTTMAASEPVIKQVSENMSAKLSSAIPGAIGNALQSMMSQQAGGAGGAMGMAAGLMSSFMNHGNTTAPANPAGGNAPVAGGNGPIQQLCQSMLGPKIAMLLKPFLAKFETQMAQTLERELREKVFSSDYIKSTVMGMLTGGGQGGAGNALLGGVMNAMMGGHGGANNANGGQQSGQTSAMNALGSLASSFLKK
ncbi:hypothetical protein BKA57DRAFT_488174 [Linnemannia elongata]|uniref:DUF937 domain-containing protein n=1 Tax=Linnemannia elongata AG-77 TaxID=1314771 RepID=A0A197K9K3_9FUNG|nr:hypothetical protein BGZ88_002564 [Linnemannia elongata]KAG0072547.1 hypothetical protein BGZ89_005128 [Linnemannia elongata]KAH7057611.1 hypothetical protein BKA57DRAFT_488174 [Linnemannia elongata]OAQ34170.1 hypothetical protein K457DRAFT_133739 [Linnemannia elongata AG-77]